MKGEEQKRKRRAISFRGRKVDTRQTHEAKEMGRGVKKEGKREIGGWMKVDREDKHRF